MACEQLPGRRQCGYVSLAQRIPVGWAGQISGLGEEALALSCDLYNSVCGNRLLRNGRRFLFRRCNLKYGRFDLPRYQLIGAYLAVLEDMCLAEQYLQYSCQASDVINRQDQKRLGTELPTNSRFNPCVCLGVLDTQNLTSSLGVG